MAGRVEGKVALITGGGSGIGRACAVRFAKEGVNVCVADLDVKAAAETARMVEAAGRKAAAVQVDTTDEAANEAMVKHCVESLGAVDVLVAAAGIGAVRVPGATSYQPHTVLSIPMDQFRRVIDVNLYGVLFSNRAVARWMTEHRRGGSIVNLASLMSKMPSTSAPPSTTVWVPLIHEASSEARKSAQRAMSSGSPTRPSGICLPSAASRSTRSMMSAVSRVRIVPGQIAFTRMRSRPYDAAIARVRASTAPFDAA